MHGWSRRRRSQRVPDLDDLEEYDGLLDNQIFQSRLCYALIQKCGCQLDASDFAVGVEHPKTLAEVP